MLQYNQRGSEDLLRQGPVESNKKHFVLQHFQGTNPVLYNADGWLQSSREDAAGRAAGNLLQVHITYFFQKLMTTFVNFKCHFANLLQLKVIFWANFLKFSNQPILCQTINSKFLDHVRDILLISIDFFNKTNRIVLVKN